MSKYHAFHELKTNMITKFLQILQQRMCHKQKQQNIKQMFPRDVGNALHNNYYRCVDKIDRKIQMKLK